jgi:methionyl-tRNA formyltransferase
VIRLKVAVITQGVSEVLKSILESGHEVVGIIECSPAHEPNSFLKKAGKFLTDIYYSFTSHPLNLRLISKKMKVPYYYFKKGDNEGLEKWVKNLEPDLIIVYSMSHLLKENVFSVPKFGTVNLHTSYLPEYRGQAPIFWEYYDYALNLGVTLHFIDKGEDTGDIIYQKRILISSGEKIEKVNQKLSFIGVKLISKMMEDLETGNIPRIKQPIPISTVRARKIKPEEYSGLIRWDDWDVDRVFHFLNGTPKYHYTLLKKNNLYKFLFMIKIMDKEKCDTSGYKIGTLYKENSKHFFVCRDGKIYVTIRPSTVGFFAWLYPFIS